MEFRDAVVDQAFSKTGVPSPFSRYSVHLTYVPNERLKYRQSTPLSLFLLAGSVKDVLPRLTPLRSNGETEHCFS